jgi:hypothetical protein
MRKSFFQNFQAPTVALAACLLFFALFAGPALADVFAVDDLSAKIDELYANEILYRGKWQRVSAIDYVNPVSGTKERDTLYRALKRVLIIHEILDGENQESRKFVTRYSTTDFKGLLDGFSPGTPENAVDTRLGRPYAAQSAAKAYGNENGMVWMIVSFRNGRAYMIDVNAPPEGNKENNPAAQKLYPLFDKIRASF